MNINKPIQTIPPSHPFCKIAEKLAELTWLGKVRWHKSVYEYAEIYSTYSNVHVEVNANIWEMNGEIIFSLSGKSLESGNYFDDEGERTFKDLFGAVVALQNQNRFLPQDDLELLQKAKDLFH